MSSLGSNGSSQPATAAEREAELIALQSAFDEYIASSRELEEELDAELAKMRELNYLLNSWKSPIPSTLARFRLTVPFPFYASFVLRAVSENVLFANRG
jgi:hypothetical protein